MALLGFFYNILKKLAGFAGFNLIITKKSEEKEGYASVLPVATYSPWLLDASFQETYEIVKKYTLVDQYRCYELWQLVAEVAKLSGALIEVGVWKGGSGALIAQKAKLLGIKDRVYLCDTFKGVVKAGVYDSSYKGGEHADVSEKTVVELINKLKLTNTKLLVGIFPDEVAHLVTDKQIRFCHIDVDVYQGAKDITEWLWPKLVIGGIIVFDDYGFKGCDGVTRFVNGQRQKRDRLVIHNLNGHAIIIKLK